MASIKARWPLANLKDHELAEATKAIGSTATAKLEALDALLTQWAKRVRN